MAGPRSESRWLAALCFFPLSLLASPITWKAHGAALLFFLFGSLWSAKSQRRIFWVLGCFYVATNLLSEELIGKQGKRDLQALSIFTWGVLALLVLALPSNGHRRNDRPTK